MRMWFFCKLVTQENVDVVSKFVCGTLIVYAFIVKALGQYLC